MIVVRIAGSVLYTVVMGRAVSVRGQLQWL